MRVGKLRNRAKVQRRTAGAIDDFGNPVDTWSDLVSARPCSIMIKGGNEQYVTMGLQGTLVYEVTFRYSAAVKSITSGDRIILTRATSDLDSDAILNIRHDPIDPTGRRDRLVVEASFGDADN